jgi:spore coat protein U-like protein
MKPFIYCRRTPANAASSTRAAGNRIAAAILSLALGGFAGSACGASCIVTTISADFGVYDVFSSGVNDTGIGKITVACTGLLISIFVSYDIVVGPGRSLSYALPRSMSDGMGHSLNYNLYTNSSRSIVWGDGSAGTAKISDGYLLGLGTVTREYSIYGRIPAGQNAYVGNYSDTPLVTISY